MSSIWIRKFHGGVDARRLPETTPAGALIRGIDGHVNRGGEFEKRAAFVPTYDLPRSDFSQPTVGLAANSTSLYVFGGFPDFFISGLPPGVTYQQLPTATPAQQRIVSWDLFNDKLYVVAQASDIEHYYDGSSAGRTGQFASYPVHITGSLVTDTIEVFVGGVSITNGPVLMTSIDALVDRIVAYTSNPDYFALNFGAGFISIFAADIGPAANGRVVHFEVVGSAVVSDGVMSGGVDAYATATRYVRTIGTKMYTLTQSSLEFSSIGNPADWDGGLGGTGFGFIDTSSYTAGSEDLTAVVEFRSQGAVFSQRTVQIWSLSADPADNALRQVLRNTGTSCPLSVTQFGDGDMFYLDESGLRSLRARDAGGNASTYGVAVRIDPLIVAKLRSLTEDERTRVTGLIEPVTGNFWLIMKDRIFVYAFFPDEGVRAWSYYTVHFFDTNGARLDFDVDDAVVFDRRVYLRSGDKIFVYGGLETGRATDATEAEAWLPYLDDGAPWTEKTWTSFDAAVSGEWSVAAGMSLADTNASDEIAVINRTTYNDPRIGLVGSSTHISLRFRSRGTGPAVLGACAIHYTPERRAQPTKAVTKPGAWAPYQGYGGDLAKARVWFRP